jgi:hypothetical protein
MRTEMATCTECNGEIEPLTKYVAGTKFVKGKHVEGFDGLYGYFEWQFSWACEHFPADEAPVRLASRECLQKFCEKHPEHVDAILVLLSGYEKECNHGLVN